LATTCQPDELKVYLARSEAARILLTSAGHNGVSADDRAYLAQLTASVTGIAAPDAQRRVARDDIRRARRAAVILAFMAGAASMVCRLRGGPPPGYKSRGAHDLGLAWAAISLALSPGHGFGDAGLPCRPARICEFDDLG
jgi:hypothetical protein